MQWGSQKQKSLYLCGSVSFFNMETITINGKTGSSKILIGESLRNLYFQLPQKKLFIITDHHVSILFSHMFVKAPVFVIKPGEASKNFATLEQIYYWLLHQGADRDCFIVGIGGGVVCDITGFVATTFMRGVPFGFVATSLLAQVDASVGGKNGVNLKGFKNIVGTFSQPEFVICDTSLLRQLPEDEFANGMAEVIKHAILADAPQFEYLQANPEKVKSCDAEALNYLVGQSVRIKAAIVEADEQETGNRRLLNLGHTWGHAVEKVTGMPHGQAVSIGLAFAAKFSNFKGYITPAQRKSIESLLQAYELPIECKASPKEVFQALIFDKKKENYHIHFVFINKIGEAIVKSTPIAQISDFALYN